MLWIQYNNKPSMSSRTSSPGKISPANAPPCSSTEYFRLQTTIGEGDIGGGAMGEGGIKGGAVNCLNTPEHTSSHQTSNSSPANIPPNPSRESSLLGMIMGEGRIKGGAMGEGGIKGGAVDCPDTPKHTSSCQTNNNSPADIPPNPSRESPPLGMIMGEGGIKGGAVDCPNDPNI